MTLPTPSFLVRAGSPEYESAAAPHNPAAPQRPASVAVVHAAAEVAATVAFARSAGLQVLPQATGHGAGGPLGDDVILLDTRGLDHVRIDPGRRVADVGAGVVWQAVQEAASPHGLLGLAGTSPSVGVASYSFGGGIGWLVRPHGLASSALLEVDYVDGSGRLRTASEDAADPIDREALWAFRGGNGVGIAVALRTELVPVIDLHAGYLLWPAAALDVVVAAWSDALGTAGPALTTSISLIQAPPGPPFPEELQGGGVVHLALASATGPDDAAAVLEAVRGAARPVVDTFGPADVERLGGIHLDPPPGAAALGDGRWLSGLTAAQAIDLLRVADGSSAVVMAEIRNVANPSVGRPGAVTTVPGPFVGHAVVAIRPGVELDAARAGLADFRSRTADVLVHPLASWAEGLEAVPDALPAADLARLVAAADAVDPEHVIRRSHTVLGAEGASHE